MENMDKRLDELMKLKSYTTGIDNELTMILQALQWDRKHLLQNSVMVTCKYDSNHKVPPDKVEEHEKECYLRNNGYSKDDQLLPEPLDSESTTLVKLKKEDIEQIIENAARSDISFKKGSHGGEPLSLERLQSSYSADERRAIHDAVVSAVPSCHDLTDLALLSGGEDQTQKVILSRNEILLELRNMRRRRTKYRVAAKSRNYSDVLRDVIRTQMEHYTDGRSETDQKETMNRENDQRDPQNDSRHSRVASSRYSDKNIMPRPIMIKTEREYSTERSRNYSREESDRSHRYEIGSRDRRDRDSETHGRHERTRESRNEDDIQKYGEHSRKRRHDDETEERRHYEEINERRKYNKPNKEYRSENRSKSQRHDMYQVKKEPGLDEELNSHRKEPHSKRRRDENKDKTYKHKDRTSDRNYEDTRRRSREKRRDRNEERHSERIHIKQEREDSVPRHNRSQYEKEKSSRSRKHDGRRHDRSHRDKNYDSYSGEVKQEKYDRYYVRTEGIYDPNMIIKEEK